jgi:hypothetical protein
MVFAKGTNCYYISDMTVNCNLNSSVFRNFTVFDVLKRRKMYRAPVTFATILTVSAVISFIMHRVDGAIFLG